MSTTIHVNDDLYKQAMAESQNPSERIQYWAKLGKTALDNPDLPIEFIKLILESKDLPTELFEFHNTEKETANADYLDMIDKSMNELKKGGFSF